MHSTINILHPRLSIPDRSSEAMFGRTMHDL